MKTKMFKFIGKAGKLKQAIQDKMAEQHAKELEKVIEEERGKIGQTIVDDALFLEEMRNAENGAMFLIEEKYVSGGVELTMARIIKVVSK